MRIVSLLEILEKQYPSQDVAIAQFASEYDVDLQITDPEVVKELVFFFKGWLQEQKECSVLANQPNSINFEEGSVKKGVPFEEKSTEPAKTAKTATDSSLQGHSIKRTKDILDVLSSFYEKEEQFKVFCNKLYKGIRQFTEDPTSPFNRAIPIFYEDLGHNDACLAQLVCLCDDYGLEVEAKEKGVFVFLNRNDQAFVQMQKNFLQALKHHKDESIISTKKEKEPVRSSHQDPSRNERVSAFLEARARRAIVGSAPQQVSFANVTSSMEQNQYQAFQINPNNYSYQASLSYPQMSPEQTMSFGQLRGDNGFSLSHNNQLKEYRDRMKACLQADQQHAGPRSMTMTQLADRIDVEDQQVMGKKCLELTNQFRQSQGLSPLQWEPSMINLGRLFLISS